MMHNQVNSRALTELPVALSYLLFTVCAASFNKMWKTLSFLRCQVRHFSLKYKVDPQQRASLKEMCILVDECDNYVGESSKETCHKVVNGQVPPLHRAFSVFLFNSNDDLLLQKRAACKITYPNYFSNSCCSHPLATIESERVEEDAVGVKLAAIRRLNHELGIPKEELSIADINYVTRIIYQSVGDGVWGEYEVDYILFMRKDVTLDPNPNEVSDIRYVSLPHFDSFMKNLDSPITPWFLSISKQNLKHWWNHLHDLDKIKDHKNIISYL